MLVCERHTGIAQFHGIPLFFKGNDFDLCRAGVSQWAYAQFVWKRFDSAYKSSNRVRSLYDDPNGVVYLITGNKDCDQIKEWASTLGQTKQESLEIAKTTDTFEVKEAARTFLKKALEYVKNPMIRKKNQQGNLMFIKALFDAEYKKNGEIKGFNFSKILFCSEV